MRSRRTNSQGFSWLLITTAILDRVQRVQWVGTHSSSVQGPLNSGDRSSLGDGGNRCWGASARISRRSNFAGESSPFGVKDYQQIYRLVTSAFIDNCGLCRFKLRHSRQHGSRV